jgi:hypothetical protein
MFLVIFLSFVEKTTWKVIELELRAWKENSGDPPGRRCGV